MRLYRHTKIRAMPHLKSPADLLTFIQSVPFANVWWFMSKKIREFWCDMNKIYWSLRKRLMCIFLWSLDDIWSLSTLLQNPDMFMWNFFYLIQHRNWKHKGNYWNILSSQQTLNGYLFIKISTQFATLYFINWIKEKKRIDWKWLSLKSF